MRTIEFTPEQKDALQQLRDDGRIDNERPCGYFDVLTGEEHEKGKFFSIVLCDTCRVRLVAWRPEVFGARQAM